MADERGEDAVEDHIKSLNIVRPLNHTIKSGDKGVGNDPGAGTSNSGSMIGLLPRVKETLLGGTISDSDEDKDKTYNINNDLPLPTNDTTADGEVGSDNVSD